MSKPQDRFANLTPLQRAFLALEDLQAKLAASERAKSEPIAIVGMGCRFPGGATDPESFWRLLREGVDAVTEVPRERWDVDSLYDPDPKALGKVNTRWGGFLRDVDRFDARFFGISPREAATMDPQQRILLEVAWEALEDAGLNADGLAGSRTGVFVGICNDDYSLPQFSEPQRIDAYTSSGTAYSIAANRISYLLDLQGPSVAVDTACSSSLVAVHLACQSLRTGDCGVALAGGVNLALFPAMTLSLSKFGMMAADGRCKTFDARANGFVRGEGAGVIVLKRLSDAQRDGDTVLAVIRGSAVNQDGRSAGLTAPNVLAQQEVLRQALANARVQPSQVSYVEAHGTGTSLGDPIEVEALKAVLGQPRPNGPECVLGAVKTNIGHLEGAAGIAGLMKVVLSLRHGRIPRNLHFRDLNPVISLEGTPFVLATEDKPWRVEGGPRIAGVSSFGFGGTNAHVVLEEAPARAPVPAAAPERPVHLLSLSAKTGEALKQLAERYAAHLDTLPVEALADVCHTAGVGRAHQAHRLAVVGRTPAELAAKLRALDTAEAPAQGASRPKVAFLFTGQGSQYADMGQGLYAAEPVFRETLDKCDVLLRPLLDKPLLSVLYGEHRALLDETAYTQPALFAVEYALAELWKSWGIVPSVVMGHSVGEYVAACVAGVFSLEDGLKLIAERGRLMQALPRDGEMVAVAAEEARVAEALAPHAGRVTIAALNGPSDTVIAGERQAVLAIAEAFTAQGVKTKRLTVSHAFHSPLMRPMVEPFGRVAASVVHSPPRLGLVSNLTGRLLESAPDAEYWRRHVLEPVRFSAGVRAVHEAGCEVLVEVGPHPTLLGLAGRCLPEGAAALLPSLRRNKDDLEELLASLGGLYVRGAEVDQAGLSRGRPRQRVRLPTYPWQRERYWLEESPALVAARTASGVSASSPLPHPLLGRRFSSPSLESTVFEAEVDTASLPFLDDHRVYGEPVLPATAYLEMVTAAGCRVLRATSCAVESLVIQEALVVPDGGRRLVQLVVTPEGSGTAGFQLVSRLAGDEDTASWTTHASGRVRAMASSESAESVLAERQARCQEEVPASELYALLRARGLELGPRFQGVAQLWRGEGESLGRIRAPEALASEAGSYPVHPAVLDACLQVFLAGLPEAGAGLAPGEMYLPLSIERFHFSGRAGAQLWSHARLSGEATSASPETLRVDLELLDETGRVLGEVRGLQLKRAPREALRRAGNELPRDVFHTVKWERVERAATSETLGAGRWLLLSDAGGVGRALAEGLEARGHACVRLEETSQPEDFAQALRGGPLRGVVYLRALDAAEGAPQEAQRRVCGGALELARALAGAGLEQAPRLWLVTRGTQAVEAGEVVSVAGSPLWGLGAVLGAEHPEWRTACVDVGPGSDSAAALLEELLSPEGEDRLALRQAGRYAARLVRVDSAARRVEVAPRADGTYLVTGGLGGLGLTVARWLVEAGARHLVLAGRQEPSESAREALTALEALGARVLVARMDVSREEDVARVLAEARASMPPLRGVVHAAGVVEDGVLVQQSWDSFARVLAPKVAGAWNLHALTREAPLDFFVLFSSASALLGTAGQGSYAAANAFLDALAQHRHALGLPALSLGWGPWSEVGMAARLGTRGSWEALGLSSLSPSRGVKALEVSLRLGLPRLAVLPIHWPTFFQHRAGGASPMFAAFASQGTAGGPVRKAPPSALLERLTQAAPAERQELLVAHVRELAVRVLGGESARALGSRQPLRELGMDSLMAVELRNALGRSVGRTLPATLAFDHPTVEALAEYLAREVLPGLTEQKPRAKPSAVKPPAPGRDEPIAIIGLGCRFPGGASTPEAYWRLLREGVDAVSDIPSERWDVDAWYDADPEAPGKMYTRRGGFLGEVDRFDPAFFGISPREAVQMDPQQRLLLEVAWEALEHAGLPPSKLSGSQTGVYVGISSNDYLKLSAGDSRRLDAYTGTGSAFSIAAGRLSYTLGLQGPSLAVDTACSSSLVALHLACQSLRNGESSVALAGGVNLILTPDNTVYFCRLKALASDGRCKTFDASADGYVRSEGCGMVVLKRLSDAQRDGDTVLAVIRGTAVNQDGRSNGLTAPNGPAQEAVIQAALTNAGVEPSQVGYVEAHGTGTALGDPIEVGALGAVLGRGRSEQEPLVLGSAKTNLGHLEAAAGMAGLIKVVLSLRNGEIPPHLHFQQLNPHISVDGFPVVIPTEAKPWAPGRRRIAGVSSFGLSGTNAHVVVEEAPKPDARPAEAEGRAVVLPLSARSEEALAQLAGAYARALAEEGAPTLGDVLHTAGARRGHHQYRGAVAGRTRQQVVEGLEALARGEAKPGVVSGREPSDRRRKVAFVFPGQGGQWKGMGKRLLEEEKAFREAVEACEAAMKPHVEWSLTKVLKGEEGEELWSRIDFVQPALFAVGVGLTALWRSWGVEPDAVVGHSMGEVAAAYVAGVLSLEDAAKVICVRSRLLRGLSGQGAMGVVELTAEEAQQELKGYEDKLSVAVSNSRRSTVLSGDAQALGEVLEKLEARGVFTRRVKVDVASHSPQMDVLRQPLLEGLAGLEPGKGKVALYSTVKGEVTTGEEMEAGYWVDNLREPVLFHRSVKQLVAAGCELVVEMGPHPVLLGSVEETLREEGVEGAAVASMRREEDEGVVAREALGKVYAHGHEVQWAKLYPSGQCVRLPSYPFQRERYWVEPPATSARRASTSGHPLLGTHQRLAFKPGTHLWETELGLELLPYMEDHRIRGSLLLPVTAYMEMALAGATEAFGGTPRLEQVRFIGALTLPEEGTVTTQLVLDTDKQGTVSFQLFSRGLEAETGKPSSEWNEHASGTIRLDAPATSDARLSLEDVRARCGDSLSGEKHYETMLRRGFDYGPSFQGVEQLWRRDGEALGRVSLPKSAPRAGLYQAHPALLDACIQVLFQALPKQPEGAPVETFLPTELGTLRVLARPGERLWCHATLHPDTDGQARSITGDVLLLDEQGQVVLELRGLRAYRLALEVQPPPTRDEVAEWLYKLKWEDEALAAPAARKQPQGSWLVLGDSGGVGASLKAGLEARGERCVLISSGDGFARPEDFARLLKESFGPGQPPCRGVVHLWSLEVSAGEPSLESALHLVQALVGMGWRDMPRLWLVTAGAQAVLAGEVPSVAQAPLWGLAKAMVYEHPELRPTLVDLDGSPSQLTESLLAELWASASEEAVALRPGARLVARLVRAEGSAEARAPGLSAEGSYLVTGGLGRLGLRVARWLVERGARSLVLVGRSAPSGSALEAVKALESAGATVTVAQVDVTREEQVAELLQRVARTLPPLEGVLHLAGGTSEEGTLRKLDAGMLARAMAPRVAGAWNLHQHTKALALDFFVLFSSAASLLGAPGQGNTAAGHAFLDALAHHRRALGLPALSINWGPWATDGEASTQASRALESLSPERALEALGRVLPLGVAQLGVLPLEVRQWRQYHPKVAPSGYLEVLVREESRPGRRRGAPSPVRQALQAAPPGERRALLEAHLREQITRVLRVAPSRIEAHTPLPSLGMDSLMAVELRNRLEASLGLVLPTTLLWRYPALESLVPHLAGKMELPLEAAEPVQAKQDTQNPELANLSEELEQLSEDELAALLAQELEDIKEGSR